MGDQNQIEHIDVDNANVQVDAVRAYAKALFTRNQELETGNKTLSNQNRTYGVKEALSNLGVRNLKVAAYVPQELDPSDAEAVKAWIEGNKDDFNFQLADATGNGESGAQGSNGNDAADSFEARQRAVQAAAQGGNPAAALTIQQARERLREASKSGNKISAAEHAKLWAVITGA